MLSSYWKKYLEVHTEMKKPGNRRLHPGAREKDITALFKHLRVPTDLTTYSAVGQGPHAKGFN